MDREVFLRGMGILTACYPDYELKEETGETYWEFLRHLSNLDFERAVKHHVSTCKWFPKVSEILDALRNQGPTPIDVWNRLIAAAETGQKPAMDATTEKALAVLGGWEVFQYTSYDDLQYRFKDFRAALLEARAQETLRLAGGEQEQKALEEI